MLEILTFTGIDEQTNMAALTEISAQYPQVEFAVLAGSQTGRENPIFPPWDTIRALRDLKHVNTALHLCGRYARQAAGEDPTGYHSLQLACSGFGRLQINLHGDEDNWERVKLQRNAVKRFAEQTQVQSVILQHQGTWDTVPIKHPRIEYLFDLSEGRGQETFDQWPEPPADCRAGYSGGIGPHNIQKAMDFVNQHQEARLWLDMERNVRTPHYWLDLDKVRQVCELALSNKDD